MEYPGFPMFGTRDALQKMTERNTHDEQFIIYKHESN